MSRRDTIIIAVLINAGLLIVLFASALKSTSSEEKVASAILEESSKTSELPVKKVETGSAPAEEVDLVLRQYAAARASGTQSSPVSSQEPAAASALNFAQDLQAISLPEQVATSSAAPPAETDAPRIIEVTVKKGDVLEKIARHHRTSVEEIMKLNNLATTRLKIGQVLKVSPDSKKKAASTSTAKTENPSASAPKYYTVKKGDNPWTIAAKNHMKVEDLLKLNNLTSEKARQLKPGDKLRIQ